MIATALSPEGRLLLFSAGLIALVSMILLWSKWGRSSPLHQWTMYQPVDQVSEDSQERDNVTIERIREAGVDMSAIRRVDFFLIFRSRDGADQAKSELEADYSVSISQAVSGEMWCTATAEMLIYLNLIREHAERMKVVATKYGGKYDGWGTSLEDVQPQPDANEEQY